MTIDTYTLRRLARSTADKVLGAEAGKAADALDAQAAEIARLRDALSGVLDDLKDRAEDGVMDISQGVLDRARAALSGESNG